MAFSYIYLLFSVPEGRVQIPFTSVLFSSFQLNSLKRSTSVVPALLPLPEKIVTEQLLVWESDTVLVLCLEQYKIIYFLCM